MGATHLKTGGTQIDPGDPSGGCSPGDSQLTNSVAVVGTGQTIQGNVSNAGDDTVTATPVNVVNHVVIAAHFSSGSNGGYTLDGELRRDPTTVLESVSQASGNQVCTAGVIHADPDVSTSGQGYNTNTTGGTQPRGLLTFVVLE